MKKIFYQLSKISRSPLWPAILSAFLAPGAGQLVNGEVLKGLLILAVFFGPIIWYSKILIEKLSLVLNFNPETWNPDQPDVQNALRDVINENQSLFFLFNILILLVWLYGVVDAYLGAKHPRRRPTPAMPRDDEPPSDS